MAAESSSPNARPGWVFYVALMLLAAFAALGIALPDTLARGADAALAFTTHHFGWLYLFATTGFLVFCLTLIASRYGDIRLGAEGEHPEFSYPTWLGMIFSAGMGVGLVFWGVAEPLSHYNEPPLDQAAPRTAEAANLALRYSLFHWGFHQWANFAVVGLAIAFVRFRQNRGGLISETFRASLGPLVDGFWGKAIDVLAVVSTVFGVATTLGLGTIQINSGLSTLVDAPYGALPQLAILGGTGVVFLLASLTPLEKGVRYVSDLNMLLAAVLLIFVFFAGPTPFITAAMTNSIGEYFANVIGMSLVMTPFTGEDWVERWTIFYWAWWFSWAPFVGSFIARISRGRTVREFLVGVMGMPVVLSALWFATFGGSALYFERFADAGIADAVATDVGSALFATLAQLPAATLLSGASLALVVLFVVTSANSATFVLGMFTAHGVLDPHPGVRVSWGGVQILIAGVLLVSGGLAALQTLSIVAAFPFMVLMIFMAVSLLRGLQADQRQREVREAELRRRIMAMLEERERGGNDAEAGENARPGNESP